MGETIPEIDRSGIGGKGGSGDGRGGFRGTLGRRRGDRWNAGKVGQQEWLEMGEEGMSGRGGPWRR